MKIGILGSSFNPAHLGHLKLSDKAIQIFDLDEVWWMITKQNPLKEKDDYMSFEDRNNQAKKLIGNNNIKLKFFEDITNSNYLIDNLKHIKSNFTEDEFIFLMGSDSFEEMDKWKNYLDIFNQMPIAVFNRNEELYNPLTSIAAEKFKNNQIKLSDAKLIFTKSPAWIFIRDFNVSESSTAIRNNK